MIHALASAATAIHTIRKLLLRIAIDVEFCKQIGACGGEVNCLWSRFILQFVN